MDEPSVLVSITASRMKGEILYSIDCANTLSNEELEHHMQQITKAIVKWRSGACQLKIQNTQINP